MSDEVDEPRKTETSDVNNIKRIKKYRNKMRQKKRDTPSTVHKYLRIISSFINNIFKIVSLLGALVISAYFMFTGFYPKGLSFGEAPFFLLTFLSFGLWSVFGLMFGFVASLAPTQIFYVLGQKIRPPAKYRFDNSTPDQPSRLVLFIRKLLWFWNTPIEREVKIRKDMLNWAMWPASMLIFIMYLAYSLPTLYNYVVIRNDESFVVFKFFFSSFAFGLFLTKAYCEEFASGGDQKPEFPADKENAITKFFRENRGTWKASLPVIMVTFFIYTVYGSPEFIVNQTMSSIGIRVLRTYIIVPEESYDDILQHANADQIRLCSVMDEKSKLWTIFDLDVFWHRIGDEARIRIRDTSTDRKMGKRKVRTTTVTIPNKGLSVGEQGQFKPPAGICSE